MNSVQIAAALLEAEGAPTLAALSRAGHKCDQVPVRVAMLRMFPDTSQEDLAAGLELAITIAGLDVAEAAASQSDWRLPD
jgi:hypothetical protein